MHKREIAIVAFAAVVLTTIFISADLLRDYANSIDTLHWNGRPLPPCFVHAHNCGGHVLGTDEVGRDILARLIVGARLSLGMSLAGAIFELIILALLFLANRAGAGVQFTIARGADAASSLSAWPFVIVVAMITFGEAPIVRLAIIALVAGALLAARAMLMIIERGSSMSLIRRAVRDWAAILLMLATVDFFGFGVQPPTPSWGNMLVNFQSDLFIAWWAAIFPAGCLFLAALSIDLSGRAIRSGIPSIELGGPRTAAGENML
jgi:peptide/nickel transport system permease protein